MKRMYLDIETLPAEEGNKNILLDLYKRKVDRGNKNLGSFEEFVESTGLDGSFGRICCVSYAIDEAATLSLSGDEKEIVEGFWKAAGDVNLYIGFNLTN